jgi:hypothetical protein
VNRSLASGVLPPMSVVPHGKRRSRFADIAAALVFAFGAPGPLGSLGALGVGLVGASCARPAFDDAHPALDAHDAPIAASEPRAELVVLVDLPAASDCDEKFDLALYHDRAVELIAWDARPSSCIGRRATIRYLSARIDRAVLVSRVKSLAQHVEVQSP